MHVKIFLLSVLGLSLISCSPIGQSRNSQIQPQLPEPKVKRATADDGMCTIEVLSDLKDLRQDAQRLLTAAEEEGKTIQESIHRKTTAFQKTYGVFRCQFNEDGQLKTLNPDHLYVSIAALDEPTPSAEILPCSADFVVEYTKLNESLKPHLERLTQLLEQSLGNLNGNESAQINISEIQNESRKAQTILIEFRNLHRDNFKCSIPIGAQIQVVTGDQIDTQINLMNNQSSTKSP